jgi:hypothetical protein
LAGRPLAAIDVRSPHWLWCKELSTGCHTQQRVPCNALPEATRAAWNFYSGLKPEALITGLHKSESDFWIRENS